MSKAEFDYDLLVIGAGSGGVRAARISAELGARVAVVEERALGGTCVNVGCIPKKLYVYASEFGGAWQDAKGFGWQASDITFDWAELRDNKITEIDRLNALYERLLRAPGVDILSGRGTLVGPQEVAVGDQRYRAEKILLATGTWPYLPEIPGIDLALTSNEIFDLEQLPERVLVVGGGYIATEFAGIFAGLGASVTQSYRGDTLLRGFDREVCNFLAEEMRKSGIDLRLNHNVLALERSQNGSVRAKTSSGEFEVDAVLMATGRKPNLEALNLASTQVRLTERGTVKVNAEFQSDEPSIFALGDLIGGWELTPVAIAQAMAFAHTQFGEQPRHMEEDFIATAVFSHPPMASVGMTEEAALEAGHDVSIFRSDFRPLKHTLSGRDERSMVKLVVDAKTDRVLGLHMVGAEAAEICQGMAIALKLGATKADFDRTIGIHPTAAEEFVTLRSMTR